MTKDRLSEFQAKIVEYENPSKMTNRQKNQDMLSIFSQAETIRDMLDTISENTKVMNSLLKENPFQSTKAIQMEMETRMNQSNTLAFKLTQNLKELEKSARLKSLGPTEQRMGHLQLTTLTKQFQEVFGENKDFVEKYHEQRKNILKRELQLTNQDLQEEELERLIDNNEAPQVFIGNHLVSEREARRQLQDLEERHDELLIIEKSLRNVKELFEKMAILIEQQKDSIDRVEHHARTATDCIEEGAIDLGKAAKNKKKFKKKMYIIIVLVLIIIIIVLLIFV